MADDQTPRKPYKVTIGEQEITHDPAAENDTAPLDGQIVIKGFHLAQEAQKSTTGAIKHLKETLDTPARQALRKTFEKIAAELLELIESYPEVQALAPFLAVELEEAQREGLYPGMTLKDLIALAFYSDGTPREGEYLPLVQKAREQLPRIMAIPGKKVTLPLDKINAYIWSRLTGEQLEEVEQFNTASSADKRKGKEALINFRIDFDSLETPGSGVTITKQLTPFDKRVYLATAALFDAGNEIMSTTQIYTMMGYLGRPSSDHIQQINASLSKMGATRVRVDSSQEAKEYKGYPVFKYDASLLPFERISAYINNQITESAIHLFREPPLVTFARERKQITAIPKQLLETPISKTDSNLRFEDYLLQQISHMKSNKRFSRKILYSSIFTACNITTTKQKQRAPGTIRKLMDYYMEQKFIAGYVETGEGITVKLQ